MEIVIKHQLGKLALRASLRDIVDEQIANGLIVLPVLLAHSPGLESLSSVHRDPFDRLLIAQVIAEGATLVTSDAVISSYPVPILW